MWSSTANADSQGPGSGTGNSVVLDAEDTLESADPLPKGIVLSPGQQTSITMNLINLNGDPASGLPNTTFQWNIISGSGVSIVAGGSSATVVVQGTGSGTATLEARATQIQETQDWIVIREAPISVVQPGPTATPPPAPTNPGTPPASIPNSQGVVTPEGASLVSSDGVETGSSPEGQALADRPAVLVRPGSVNDFFGISVESIDLDSLAPMPSRFMRGSSAASITFYDSNGVEQTNFRLLRSARVCLPTASSDLVNGISNVKILRFSDAVNQWVELTTNYNVITQQACANASNFSNFAIGVQELPPTPGADGGLPATGGWSPTTGMLLLAGLLGLVLIGGGAVSMRRARNAARPE